MLQAKVLHQYKPQDKEELQLHPEDIITEVVELQDGWCRVRYFMAAWGNAYYFDIQLIVIVSHKL